MKRMLIGIAAAASLLSTGAFAADLAARPYSKAPVYVEPVYNWTGFYIGGNVGYSWGRSRDTATLTTGAGTVLFTDTLSHNMDGVVGGGQIGYNWQTSNWLWGLEADFQGTGQRGDHVFICPAGICTPGLAAPGPAVPVALDQKLEWFGTFRGRVGVAVVPTVVLYATGGLAYGDVKTSATVAGLGTTSSDNVRVGWTVGGGVEAALGNSAWTAKLEYLYMDIGRSAGTFATTTGALGGGTLVATYNSRVTDNIVRAGLNYRFGGPVIAKY
jgi:outer membrane immunogenic protein